MLHIPDRVGALERDLREIFGSRLQSLVAYGLGSDASGVDHDDSHDAHSALEPHTHTMAIVESLTAPDLRACALRAAKWHDAGLATPLLLGTHEFERALDAFPLEFGAILADHVVVAGASPFDGLTVDLADLRRACEVQARSHLLHLRQGYIEARDRGDALAVLIVRSAAPFAGLLTSVARLQNATVAGVGAAARHVERTLGLTGGVIAEVAGFTRVKEVSSADAVRVFPPYLEAVERLVAYVDAWTNA
jgi:hypothetical protein